MTAQPCEVPEITQFIYVREINGSYQAVHMWFNTREPEIQPGFWEPWDSGEHYADKEHAEFVAKHWAEGEEIHYGLPGDI